MPPLRPLSSYDLPPAIRMPPPPQSLRTYVDTLLTGLQAQQAATYWTRQTPPLVLLLRGAPGAGKSTWAARYRARWPDETLVISATDYFRAPDGVVHFRMEKLADSHEWCRNALMYLCDARVPRVVVDNTHLSPWTYTHTVAIAWRYAYRVFQYVCRGTYQNTSDVSHARVLEMRTKFEEDATLPFYCPGEDGMAEDSPL